MPLLSRCRLFEAAHADWWECALTVLAIGFVGLQLALFAGWSSLVAAGLLMVASTVRRRRPLLALGVALAGVIAFSMLAGPSLTLSSGLLVWTLLLVILFSVTLSVSPPSSGLCALVVIGVVYLCAVLGPSEFASTDGLVLAMVPWTLSVWGVSATVRSQRRATGAAQDRLQALQQLQEEEIHHYVVEERLRIARDLHDELAHEIAVISMNSGAAEAALANNPQAASRSLRRVRESSRRVLAELQAILGLLRMDERPALTVEGLLYDAAAMGLAVEGELAGIDALAPDQTDVARRVMREVLTNARRYSDGRLVLQGRCEDGLWSLTATNRVRVPRSRRGAGYGLAGMRERVQGAGGSLRVDDDGEAFVLDISLPLRAVST